MNRGGIVQYLLRILFLLALVLLFWGLFFGGNEIKTIIFLVAILSTLIFGNFWCGFLCPVTIIQMLLSALRRKLHIPAFRVSQKTRILFRPLKWLVFIFVLVLIVLSFLRPDINMHPESSSGLSIIEIIIIGALIGICFMNERAFCRYCPLLTIMGLVNKFSFGRIRKNGAACTHCRACHECCPMNIRSIYQERIKPDVTHMDCIYCLHCIGACPERDVLSFTLFGKTIMSSGRNKTHHSEKNGKSHDRKI